ncbi:ACP S-malonyltransferase [Paraburkholderia sp. Tr-20389]|uniref:ACP S-malonyltransferase n=1 Tax=Paraburkholderia sp. Tr-20389 TaxID=2703903 RepID=UPI001981E898|nr:ACP S-malonyltransferase [Paraburkholderia sp. Tr-20389]MBN3758348.1 ACP S-malonyltransferase [Paraburkholderia sp. Tr-20389]
MTVWMFPGQGTQAVGMGKGLFLRYPLLIEEADDVLGYSCKALCLDDPDGKLHRTRYAQPAIYVCNALHLAERRENGEAPRWCAGHSLGEYSALYAAGAFGFADGLRLVQRRGELFEDCGGGTGMAAVVGLTQARIRAVLRDQGIDGLHFANLNTPLQSVIAGPLDALDAARVPLEAAGCALFRRLAVSGAFHSPHVASTKQAFAQALDRVAFEPLAVPVVSNVTARPVEAGRLADYLCEQIDHPVRWAETLRYLQRQGATRFEEVGYGNVLSGLYRALQRESVEACERING